MWKSYTFPAEYIVPNMVANPSTKDHIDQRAESRASGCGDDNEF